MEGTKRMEEILGGPYTVEDLKDFPEEERVELIDGRMFRMDAPKRIHQQLVGELYLIIANYIDSKQGACEVYLGPFGIYINNDNRNYLLPDIVVICNGDKLDEDGCHGAPDWVIEVVSPSSVKMDYKMKLFKYRTTGVREYWIVDSVKKVIEVHNFEQDFVKEYTFDDIIPAGIYNDLAIDMKQLMKKILRGQQGERSGGI